MEETIKWFLKDELEIWGRGGLVSKKGLLLFIISFNSCFFFTNWQHNSLQLLSPLLLHMTWTSEWKSVSILSVYLALLHFQGSCLILYPVQIQKSYLVFFYAKIIRQNGEYRHDDIFFLLDSTFEPVKCLLSLFTVECRSHLFHLIRILWTVLYRTYWEFDVIY